MARNICIFSDGTGQGGTADSATHSNIYRLYLGCRGFALDMQDCFYDPGLGSKNSRHRRGWGRVLHDTLSRATGLGITRNIKDCYTALVRTYEPGDRIFLFGFSRGAYTVRSLGGVLALCGIPTVRDGTALRGPGLRLEDEGLLRPPPPVSAAVDEAIDGVYKASGTDEERQSRGADFQRAHRSVPAAPYFIGVWDTVRALGVPGLSDLLGFRHRFHNTRLSAAVPHARHVLSIDERRRVFEPVLWDTSPQDVASGRIRQVWFPGVHSDVGGAYADDRGLGDLTLAWMIGEARAVTHPLLVDPSSLSPALRPDPLGAQHDETARRFNLWSIRDRERFHDIPYTDWATLADPSLFERLEGGPVPHPGGERRPYRPTALRRRLPDWRRPAQPPAVEEGGNALETLHDGEWPLRRSA